MILDEILANKYFEVERAMERQPLDLLKGRLHQAPPVRDFAGALRSPGMSIIAEFKRASPSRGAIRPGADPAEVATLYAKHGAAALSVLTDQRYFQGHPEDLRGARDACDLPVLRKDFILEAYQIYESRLLGADAVLLIVRAVKPDELCELLALTAELGMTALVECHDKHEVEVAVGLDAGVIGINNRDLETFGTDLQTTLGLRRLIPDDRLVVSESGISSRRDVELLERQGVDAVLVGTTLMQSEDIGLRLRELQGL